MNNLRLMAQQNNSSLSQYAREILQNPQAQGWPKDYWGLYGALDDESFIVPQDLSFSDDIPRPDW